MKVTQALAMLLTTVCLTLFAAGGVEARKGPFEGSPERHANPNAEGKKTPLDGQQNDGVTAVIAFTALEQSMIFNYFATGGEVGGPPPRPLPPGIAKKVARGGTLPPGIAKRYLPVGLNTQLPPPPAGCERIIVGTDVLLVQIATGAIFDLIRNAVR